MTDVLEANLARIRQAIAQAAARVERDPQTVRLVAITKTVPTGRIRAAAALGCHDVGENRMQEALPKLAALPDLCWHFVGHLQTNKARDLRRGFRWFHACDSLRLAQLLAAQRVEGLAVLLQVNVAGEPQKFGFTPAALHAAFPTLMDLGLELQGLMTMAPVAADLEAARPYFRALRQLREDVSRRFGLPLPELSMGMTGDFAVAVEEGATMVRLGRALFGARPP